MTTADDRRSEALRRLAILESKGLHPNVASDFSNFGRVNYSERARMGGNVYGILYWVDNDTAASRGGFPFADAIASFEEKYNATAYHAIHEFTDFGELLDILYVSDYVEEWASDRSDLDSRCPLVYSVNLDEPLFSEFGCIGIELSGGGLVRTS